MGNESVFIFESEFRLVSRLELPGFWGGSRSSVKSEFEPLFRPGDHT